MSDTNHSLQLDHVAKVASEKAKNEYVKEKIRDGESQGVMGVIVFFCFYSSFGASGKVQPTLKITLLAHRLQI